jgi:hypothetical protein
VQSGHQASGLKLVPASGSTSRCPQHSGPSSGGRRQRHDLNFITAAELGGVPTAAGGVASAGEPDGGYGSDIGFQFYANANGFFQLGQGVPLVGRHERDGATCFVRASGASDAMHVRVG